LLPPASCRSSSLSQTEATTNSLVTLSYELNSVAACEDSRRHSIAASGRLVVLTSSVCTAVSQPFVDMTPAVAFENDSVGSVQPL